MSELRPDPAASLAHLGILRPAGPWLLTAIKPNGKGIATREFGPATAHAAGEWVAAKNGDGWNVYVHVNDTRPGLSKKAERTDITAVTAFHVDLDPRAFEPKGKKESEEAFTARVETHNREEGERIRALLGPRLPDRVPPPHLIVQSGPFSFQGFWFLAHPIPIDGDIAKAEDAKRYNQWLEQAFGADNCHNIDRVMRLAGTVNWPDAKKLAKGRRPFLARVHSYEANRDPYLLTAFKQAPLTAELIGLPSNPTRSRAPAAGSAAPAPALPSAKRVGSLDELNGWAIPDRVKRIIGQGEDPETPRPDWSRSEWLFDCVCQLVRAKVPDDLIFGIITDPEWAIAASVVEKSDRDAYAARQIRRAHEEAEHPRLREFNDRFAVLRSQGGKLRVFSRERTRFAEQERSTVVLQSRNDFIAFYENDLIETGLNAKGDPVRVNAGKWWWTHPERRSFEAMCFRPGDPPVVDGRLNLWEGFAVEPRPGSWALMQSHILDVLADGNEELAEWIVRFAAFCVQFPGRPAEVALVFKGKKGTGKGIFARALKDLFGQHGLQIYNSKHFTGNFNAHLRDCCLLFADEAVRPGDRNAEAVLKGLITEPTITIEGKGVDLVEEPNCLHVVMASNEEWFIPASEDERRYQVLNVSPKRRGDIDYFAALANEMKSGGLAAMLFDLLAFDLDGWRPAGNVIETEGLREQKRHSLGPAQQWWLGLLEAGELPDPVEGKPAVMYANGVGGRHSIYTAMRESSPRLRDLSDVKLSDILKAFGWVPYKETRARGWRAPPLADARRDWADKHGPADWSAGATWGGDDETPF